jgi:hypothetical protein
LRFRVFRFEQEDAEEDDDDDEAAAGAGVGVGRESVFVERWAGRDGCPDEEVDVGRGGLITELAEACSFFL